MLFFLLYKSAKREVKWILQLTQGTRGGASTRIRVSCTRSHGGFSTGLRLVAQICLFLNHLCLLVSCPFLQPLLSLRFFGSHLELSLYRSLGRIVLWWNHFAALPTSLPIWIYFCSDTDLAVTVVDSYIPNSFQVVPQAWPTKGNQAKDPLTVFRRHILESLRMEKAWFYLSGPPGLGRRLRRPYRADMCLHKSILLSEMIFQSNFGRKKKSQKAAQRNDKLGDQQLDLVDYWGFFLCTINMVNPVRLYLPLHLCSQVVRSERLPQCGKHWSNLDDRALPEHFMRIFQEPRGRHDLLCFCQNVVLNTKPSLVWNTLLCCPNQSRRASPEARIGKEGREGPSLPPGNGHRTTEFQCHQVKRR